MVPRHFSDIKTQWQVIVPAIGTQPRCPGGQLSSSAVIFKPSRAEFPRFQNPARYDGQQIRPAQTLRCRKAVVEPTESRFLEGDPAMNLLYWALVALVVAIVAGALGFGGIAAGAASIAKILFGIFVVVFLVLLVMAIVGTRKVV
jgi:uncharacterized membrane protein YtjA (UPF0391 family)